MHLNAKIREIEKNFKAFDFRINELITRALF